MWSDPRSTRAWSISTSSTASAVSACSALPCNQFAAQEPGSEAEIREFCSLNYGVSFPISAKVEVNGPGRHPLYLLLAGEGAEFPGEITWNFEKFLVGPDGRVLERFSPRIAPEDAQVVQAIEKALAGVAA